MKNFIITEQQRKELYQFISKVTVSGEAVHAVSGCMRILQNAKELKEEKPAKKRIKSEIEKIHKHGL